MDIASQYWVFFLGLLFTVVLMVGFLVAGLAGWRGEDDDCITDPEGNRFCEKFRTGMIKQPSNTWSNLAFVLVGLVILWFVGTANGGGAAPADNPMRAPSLPSTFYGLLVIFLGPASMVFHASMKRWAGWIDNLSMNLYISFILFYDIARMAGMHVTLFLVIFVVVNAGLAILVWRWRGSGKLVFGIVVACAVITDVVPLLILGVGSVERKAGWLVAGLSLFALAFVIWLLSGTRGPLCKGREQSLLQGHAAWHLLTAATTGCIFLYLRTEAA
jgi:hypothetical protein